MGAGQGARTQHPTLLPPVSPHGFMVFHDDSELSTRVQGSSLQVPLEALEGRRGEPGSAPSWDHDAHTGIDRLRHHHGLEEENQNARPASPSRC